MKSGQPFRTLNVDGAQPFTGPGPSLSNVTPASSLFPRFVLRLSSAAVLATAVAVAPAAARAQHVEAYVTFSENHLTNTPTGVVMNGSTATTQYDTANVLGFGYGVSLRLLSAPKVWVALDARGTRRPTVTDSMDDGLFGVKVATSTPVLHVRPYVEGTAGFMSVRRPNTSDVASGRQTIDNAFASHFAIAKGFVGVDLPVKPYFYVRLAEVGFGSSFGETPNSRLLSVNSGVVFRF